MGEVITNDWLFYFFVILAFALCVSVVVLRKSKELLGSLVVSDFAIICLWLAVIVLKFLP